MARLIYRNEKKKMTELLQKYITGEATPNETRQIMEWIAEDDAHMDEYRNMRRLHDLVLWQTRSQDEEAAREPKRNTIRLSRIVAWSLRIAAMLLVVVGVGYLIHLLPMNTGEQTIVVPAGQHVELLLADGTQVWLNSGSRLTFGNRIFAKCRKVSLEGEGYFKVAPDKKHPFIVDTYRHNIRVTGTEFNVMAYHKDSIWEAALLSGGIDIVTPKNEKTLLKMHPGQKVVAAPNGTLICKALPANEQFRWREGLICFENIDFSTLLDKLELYYDVHFETKNKRILQTRFTGKFHISDGIMHVMRVLSIGRNFTFEKDEETNTITIY